MHDPYQSGLPRPHKGTGTDTIFDFRSPTHHLTFTYRLPLLLLPFLHPLHVHYFYNLELDRIEIRVVLVQYWLLKMAKQFVSQDRYTYLWTPTMALQWMSIIGTNPKHSHFVNVRYVMTMSVLLDTLYKLHFPNSSPNWSLSKINQRCFREF